MESAIYALINHGDRIGDLTVLWELEEGLRRQPISAAINRGAHYMSNWDGQLDAVRKTGTLQAMYPSARAFISAGFLAECER